MLTVHRQHTSASAYSLCLCVFKTCVYHVSLCMFMYACLSLSLCVCVCVCAIGILHVLQSEYIRVYMYTCAWNEVKGRCLLMCKNVSLTNTSSGPSESFHTCIHAYAYKYTHTLENRSRGMICLMRKEVSQAEDLLNQAVTMCREAGSCFHCVCSLDSFYCHACRCDVCVCVCVCDARQV